MAFPEVPRPCRETEIEHPHAAWQRPRTLRGQHQQIRRLQVAMEHAGPVQRLEAMRDSGGDVEEGGPVVGPDRLVGGKPGNVLHRIERHALGGHAEFVDAHHRGVVDPGQRFELVAHRDRQLGVVASGQPFERALGAGGGVARQEDLAHAAVAQVSQEKKASGEAFDHGIGRSAPRGPIVHGPSLETTA